MSKKRAGLKQVQFGRSRTGLDSELLALMRLVEASRFPDVEVCARRIVAKRPKQPLAMKALGFALIGMLRFEDALPVIDASIGLSPNDPELHNNRGIVLSSLMRWDESLESFRQALALHPNDPEVLKNLGVAFFRMHRWDEAVPCFLKAIEIYPGDYVDAIKLLADTLLISNRVDEAWTCFDELRKNDSENLWALSQLIFASLRKCYWHELSDQLEVLRRKTNNLHELAAAPFVTLAWPGVSNAELKSISENYLRTQIPAAYLEKKDNWLPHEHKGMPSRLKIGYFSADFKDHPVGHVIPELIERHDRSRVEVVGYSLGTDDGSDIRRRLAAAFDHFVDLAGLGFIETAERIRADGIHILIDLHGWTSDGRPESLALRCAPVQATWLGYAGTLGHPRLADYLIGDHVVTPFEHGRDYAEILANMPFSYMPADTTNLPGTVPSRSAACLPNSGFVYCSFNNSYKFNSNVFDLWCRILRETPDSYLWLSQPPSNAATNLRDEAKIRGVDPERLIFASRVKSRAEHLARLQLADLALDPFPYNSHSTGVDVLWAGVPMVALQGNTFPGRVGASLLRATALDDLVALSEEDYFKLAVGLAQDRDRLVKYREHLAKRQALPLFNMSVFAGALEEIYSRMWADHLAGIRRPIAIN